MTHCPGDATVHLECGRHHLCVECTHAMLTRCDALDDRLAVDCPLCRLPCEIHPSAELVAYSATQPIPDFEDDERWDQTIENMLHSLVDEHDVAEVVVVSAHYATEREGFYRAYMLRQHRPLIFDRVRRAMSTVGG